MFSSKVDLGNGRRVSTHVLVAAGLAAAVLALAGCGNASMKECQDTDSCADAGGDGGAGKSIDGAAGSSDASPGSTDAGPVDLCAGVDCSELDDSCNRGECDPDTGGCAPQPINEDMQCADPLCGTFGACSGFENLCDEIGGQVRTCQDLTCRAGACVVGAAYEDERNCSRDTDGITCDVPQSSCGACGGFSSSCDGSGMRTCTTTTFACGTGTCRSTSTSSMQACTRVTEGIPCETRSCNFGQGTQQLCCTSQMCSAPCGDCIVPRAPTFR
jgi:hypothetical protein